MYDISNNESSITSINQLHVNDGSKALVLFSGGLDSTTCLALALQKHTSCLAISFSYGQRHKSELDAATRIAKKDDTEHLIITLDQNMFLQSALTDQTNTLAVPKNTLSTIENDIPITYVPARNTLFLAYALAIAESHNIQDIYIGVNAVDYSGYPDCRPEFIQAFQKMANLATKTAINGKPITIHTPLIHMSKQEIITLGISLQVDYTNTVSCYDPNTLGHACGTCDSCLLRKQGFSKANVKDPTEYYT